MDRRVKPDDDGPGASATARAAGTHAQVGFFIVKNNRSAMGPPPTTRAGWQSSCDSSIIATHGSNTSPRSRGAFLRPGCLPQCFAHPHRGRAERRETFGCLRDTRWARSNVACQAPSEALASHDAGRSPLGAPPWRFWALGPRFSHRHPPSLALRRASARIQRAPSSLPRQAVTSRRRRTPLPAPPSGSSLEDAPR
jgi:hypothetical protein